MIDCLKKLGADVISFGK